MGILADNTDESDLINKAYNQQLLNAPQKPVYEAGDIFKGIKEEKGVGNKLLAALSGALNYLGTGQGKKLISGFIKNPYSAGRFAEEGEQQVGQENALKSAYQQSMSERMKGIGELVKEQQAQNLEAQIRKSEIIRQEKAKQDDIIRQQQRDYEKRRLDEETYQKHKAEEQGYNEKQSSIESQIKEKEKNQKLILDAREQLKKDRAEGKLQVDDETFNKMYQDPLKYTSSPSRLGKLPFIGKFLGGKSKISEVPVTLEDIRAEKAKRGLQ